MRSRYLIATLTAIVLVGLALRTYQLSARSLWFDEAFAWRLVQFPFAEMIQRIGQDNHPPLYFILLKGWAAVFGESAFALRSLSVVFGVLTILGVYLFAVEAFGNTATDATTENLAGKPLSPVLRRVELGVRGGIPQVSLPPHPNPSPPEYRGRGASETVSENRTRGQGIGLLAAAFVALSAFQIRYSWEMRMYALAAALAVFSSWALFRALRPPSRPPRWLLYGVLALFLAYTHYYALFTLAAQAIFVIGFLLVRDDWKLLEVCRSAIFRHAVLTAIVVTLCWLPWLSVFLQQRAQVQQNYWTGPVNRWSLVQSNYQLFVPPADGHSASESRSQQLFVADLCVLGLWVLRRKANMGEWFVLSAVVVPALLALLVSAYDTHIIGAPRFFLIVHLFLLLGLATLVWHLPGLERAIAIVFLLAGSVGIDADFWNTMDVAHKPGARGAAEYISRSRVPGEPVVVSFTLFYCAVRYHAQDRDGFYLYTDGSLIPHHHGSAVLTPEDFITEEQLRALGSRRVWVVNMAGGNWGYRSVPVPATWKEKNRATFPEVFGLGDVLVVDYETKEPESKPENDNR